MEKYFGGEPADSHYYVISKITSKKYDHFIYVNTDVSPNKIVCLKISPEGLVCFDLKEERIVTTIHYDDVLVGDRRANPEGKPSYLELTEFFKDKVAVMIGSGDFPKKYKFPKNAVIVSVNANAVFHGIEADFFFSSDPAIYSSLEVDKRFLRLVKDSGKPHISVFSEQCDYFLNPENLPYFIPRTAPITAQALQQLGVKQIQLLGMDCYKDSGTPHEVDIEMDMFWRPLCEIKGLRRLIRVPKGNPLKKYFKELSR